MIWLMLNQAIVENNIPKFRLIVQENPEILEQRCPKSLDTALHLATKNGYIELVGEILGLSPSMASAENNKGETPLHEACRRGYDKILMMLLETDPWAAYKLNCENQSALYLACCYGHFKAVNIFLNQPWLQDFDDTTFLHVAAANGHLAIVRKILEKYPSIVQKLDENGYSPLHHACSRGHPEIASILLRQDPQQAFQFNRAGYAPVHLAAMNGNLNLLKGLLSTVPTSFELLSRKGETVYHLMVMFDMFNAFLYLSQVLENKGLLCQPDKNGNNCLHLAISRGNFKIAEYIIKEVIVELINYKNSWGDTPMDLLAQCENTSSIQNLKDILHSAGGRRKIEVHFVKEATVEQKNHKNSWGDTPMDLISQYENTSRIHNPKDVLDSVGGKRKIELTDSTEKVGTSNTTKSTFSHEIDDTEISITSLFSTNNEPKTESTENMSAADNEVADAGQQMRKFGEWESSSGRKKSRKRRLQKHRCQSEKMRTSLIEMYRQQQKRHELYREALHNARETIILIAVLIATVTYSSGINPPGGVFQDGSLRGTAVAGRRTAFKVFSICNNVALFASLSIVIVLVSIIPFRRKPLMMMLMVAHKVMWVAVGFMAAAYFAASLVLMPPAHGRKMEWTVVSLLSICAGTLGSVFLALGFLLTRHHLKKMRYRKKGTDCSESPESVEDYKSKNSDLNVSEIMGYHAY